MPAFRMTLCYEGNTPNTIQGRIEAALSELLDQPVEVQGSGRTDAGVHARMQTASFRAKTRMPPEKLLELLRAALPADIGVLDLCEAGPRFHARLNCTGKTYVYRIWNSDAPNVFERRWQHVVTDALDLAAMQRAGDALCGTHDFTSFCANRHMKKSPVRTLRSVTVTRMGGEVRLTFTGDGFLYHMVRILAGTLIAVGRGARAPEEMEAIIAARDRAAAGETAPAQGLTLWETEYD